MSGKKRIEILLFCHHDDWHVKGEYNVEIEVEGLPFAVSKVMLTHYRIDQAHSNAHTEWVRLGRPNYPRPAQTKIIRSREGLELYEPKSEVVLQDGKFKKTIALPVHGISLLTLTPR